MLVFPNAKINLGLSVTSKRPDGFHTIESCFYPVPWTDALEITENPEVNFSSTGIEIPGNSNDNLCIKAWYALKEKFDIPAVHIHLHKTIPIGAGLGGGSADAAFTVTALNELFELKLTEDEMENVVRPLGSDCAFFIRNRPVIAKEKGDEFIKTDLTLQGFWGVLLYPELHISTKEAYNGVIAEKPAVSINEIITQPMATWQKILKNDFEKHLFTKYSILAEVKSELYKSGAIYASMTGSGSCIYGIFDFEPDTSIFESRNFSVRKFIFN